MIFNSSPILQFSAWQLCIIYLFDYKVQPLVPLHEAEAPWCGCPDTVEWNSDCSAPGGGTEMLCVPGAWEGHGPDHLH